MGRPIEWGACDLPNATAAAWRSGEARRRADVIRNYENSVLGREGVSTLQEELCTRRCVVPTMSNRMSCGSDEDWALRKMIRRRVWTSKDESRVDLCASRAPGHRHRLSSRKGSNPASGFRAALSPESVRVPESAAPVSQGARASRRSRPQPSSNCSSCRLMLGTVSLSRVCVFEGERGGEGR